jgi:serine/threonine protein kinase
MFATTPASFVHSLREYEVVSGAQADEIARTFQPRFTDVRSLAQELVRRGYLTAFQAAQLVQGRGQDLVVGPYRLVNRLGEGGLGEVFKARHAQMDRVVALKLIQKAYLSRPEAIQRFKRETRAAAQLSHPNIVVAHDAGQAGENHYLAMEYLEGVDLARLVQQSGRLAIPLACDLIRQAALGLQYAFKKGVIHRDIKPGNLLVTKTGTNGAAVVKILDFGLARLERETGSKDNLTQLDKVVGTVDYISPEQAENSRKADVRSDIYGLGCSLFYLLSGEPPFPGETSLERLSARLVGKPKSIRLLRSEVPEALEQVLEKMLERDPARRFQTPAKVAEALKPFSHTGKVKARTPNRVSSNALAGGKEIGEVVAADSEPPSRALVNPFANLQDEDKTSLGRSSSSPDMPKPGTRRAGKKPLLRGLIIGGVVTAVLAVILVIVFSRGGDGNQDPGAIVTRDEKTKQAKGKNSPDTDRRNNNKDGQEKKKPIPDGEENKDNPKKKEPPPGIEAKVPPTVRNSLGMEFVKVPAGTFWMSAGGNNAQHDVIINRAFQMGVYPVTQGQWQAVMGNNPSVFSRFGGGKGAVQDISDEDLEQFPVEEVSWNDIQEFLKKLNASEKERGWLYDLPTEAEWEYACRGAASSKEECSFDFYLDKPTNDLSSHQANFKGDEPAGNAPKGPYLARPCKVGSYPPNKLGLYDMNGNVWQWCADFWDPDHRVVRGGAWGTGAGECRAAFRHGNPPTVRGGALGFRLVRFPSGK